MGLLDEAIREHLELKRRSGVDLTTVEREEREALAPVFPDQVTGPDGDGAVPVDDHRGENARLADLSTVGQDTAELDMQAMMEEDPDAADAASPVSPIADGPARSAYVGQASGEDPLEWEAPSERERESVPDDVPGQERLSFE